MKLLTITTKYFLLLIAALLVAWCAIFYFSLRWTIYSDIDEYLISRRHEIQKSFIQNPALITEKFSYQSDFKVKQVGEKEYLDFSTRHYFAKFKDVELYDEVEREDEPFRKMESVFISNNKYYKLTIFASLLNSEELLVTILVDIFIFSVILLGLIFILNRLLLRKLWKPFYETLASVKQYKLDKDMKVELPATTISEFKNLNTTLEALIQNNVNVYQNQKQFIENASHEMQTPLGVIQNKVYLLMEEPELTNSQAAIIDDITEHIERLSRLNKTLLLLSKIENKQFSENDSIQLGSLIESCCEDFADLVEFKKLELKLIKKSNPEVTMNVDLARILFSNLIKNSINHNINNGFIEITIEDRQVIIANSGKALTVNPETLFERFTKKSDSTNSNGLGLAIARTIGNLYDFTIVYSYHENTHVITLLF